MSSPTPLLSQTTPPPPCTSAASILKDWSLEGRNYIVTGGTSGIGLATVKALLAHKAKIVIVCSRSPCWDPIVLDELNNKYRSSVDTEIIHISCDVSTPDGRNKLYTETKQKIDILHGLVNNVGWNVRKTYEDQTDDEYYTIMRTNIDSAYFLCKLFKDMLMKASCLSSSSSSDANAVSATAAAIVNVSSAAGTQSSGTGIAYGISKAAMNHFTRTLACEWASYNIRVNAVTPWMTMTPMLDQKEQQQQQSITTNTMDSTSNSNDELHKKVRDWTPMHRLAQPNEIAAPIVFLLMPCNSYMTGQILGVDGGLTAQGFDGPCIGRKPYEG